MPETRPQMHDVVVVDSEENVQLDSWQREASGLFLALGSSISTQLEGGSIWILAFRWYFCLSRQAFVLGGSDSRGKTPNPEC